MVVNEAGTLEDCNPSAELLFLRRRAELVGARFVDLGLSFASGPRRGEPVESEMTLGIGFSLTDDEQR